MKKCIFAGTFDPFTVGHEETVKKSLAIFDEVVVAVAINNSKRCMFSADEREKMLRLLYENDPHVRVLQFSGAIVDLLKREATPFYVRGVRNAIDFEYENADFFASRKLDKDMITVYIPCEQELLHVSSTLVKNCMTFKKPFERYVPQAVYEFITRGNYVPKTD